LGKGAKKKGVKKRKGEGVVQKGPYKYEAGQNVKN